MSKERLSLAEAKRLSLLKWEYIKANISKYGNLYDCEMSIVKNEEFEELSKLRGRCGFCERHNTRRVNFIKNCDECEFKIAMNEDGCFLASSTYQKLLWEKYRTKEERNKMVDKIVDALKSIKTERQ